MDIYTIDFSGEAGLRRIKLAVASTPLERMRGLLGRPRLEPGEGMLLQSCRLIHTVGMGYPLDLIYLDRAGLVLKVTTDLPAFRMDGHWRAHSVLEMAAGEAEVCGICQGVRLPFDCALGRNMPA
ncbi:DUF192 domain-containing protein [Massilia forsythiae]|uniref:DUF192 domain-containing protein n=1 Tax=Massilia forsythiae TaxID=2728020 RepID=A0A7Z2W0V0_9BURK|nr:DUF192 domain-containing protein [Massilia forsythiae]QJE02824.1 DUF192 domain-containing protein [Massilia forsythiae]